MGTQAIAKIQEAHPTLASNIELVQMDVGNDESVAALADSLRGVTLYAIVNNAGVGFRTDPDSRDVLLNTNFYGPKRVTEAFLGHLDPEKGRIVNVSSGAASMWLRNQSKKTKNLFSSSETTWEELETSV